MNGDRFFLDTAYILARVDRSDQYPRAAVTLARKVRAAAEVWISEAVLIEVGNALSSTHRLEAANFIQQCYRTPNMRVIPLTTELMFEALDLYRARDDKRWGLTDCISFVVMQTTALSDALTSDHHFRQAGFRAPLLEEG